LRAEIAYRIGVELRELENVAEAETELQRAVTAAEAGRDDRLATFAWIRLASVARARDAYDEAARRIEQATAKLARIGNPPDVLGFLLANKAQIEHQHGELDVARADYEHAIAVYEKIGAERPRVASSLTLLARLYGELGLNDLRSPPRSVPRPLAEKIRGRSTR